jgi:hypothetical protein
MVRGQGGWHPPSSASTNLTQAVSGRSSGSRIFPPPATNPARIRRVSLDVLGDAADVKQQLRTTGIGAHKAAIGILGLHGG